MEPENQQPRLEREQTDESLRVEREKADQTLEEGGSTIDETADARHQPGVPSCFTLPIHVAS